MTECHFANRKQGTAYVQAVINGVARVPDELLQVAAPIKAYGYVSDGAGGQTRYALTMRAASLVEKGLLDTADLEPLAKALDEREAAEETQEVTDSTIE